MAQRDGVGCQACGWPMTMQMDRLDLGWAGDGPYERDGAFAGILADVFSCGRCGRVAIAPTRLERPFHRTAA